MHGVLDAIPMNTVTDDNKMLTLLSNEQLPFSPDHSPVPQIQDMKLRDCFKRNVYFINKADVCLESAC